MDTVLEILKYVLPALVVFFTAYFSIKQLIKNERSRRNFELITKNKQIVTPIRLQAYERLALFLERISPENLVMKYSKEQLNVSQLQNQMLKTIRSEFDHNVSQQIYISPQAWEVIKGARENTVKLINATAQQYKPNESALKLSRALLEKVMSQQKTSTQTAIEYLKREVRNYF